MPRNRVWNTKPKPKPPEEIFHYAEGGKRPRTVRIEAFRPLHQTLFENQPRTGTASSSRPSTSQENAEMPAAVDYGKAMRSLWDLQAMGMRKPMESVECAAPCVHAIRPASVDQPRMAPSTAPAGMRRSHSMPADKERDKRCDEVVGRLLRDSGHWGIVQEKQSRLMDTNRDLMRQNDTIRRELKKETQQTADFRSETWGDSWKSFKPSCITSMGNVHFPYQTSTDAAYGVKDIHHLTGMRSISRTTFGHEYDRKISRWGAEQCQGRDASMLPGKGR